MGWLEYMQADLASAQRDLEAARGRVAELERALDDERAQEAELERDIERIQRALALDEELQEQKRRRERRARFLWGC